MRALRTFLTEEDATTAVEYAVLLALIIISCIGAVRALGSGAGGMWGSNQTKLQEAGF